MKGKKIVSGLWVIFLFFSLGLFLHNKAYAETIELKISHIGKEDWTPIKYVLEPWVKKIEQLTNGRVKFTFYGNQVLGKSAEQYDLVIKGTADISVSLLSYNPGRFPLASVMESRLTEISAVPLITKS